MKVLAPLLLFVLVLSAPLEAREGPIKESELREYFAGAVDAHRKLIAAATDKLDMAKQGRVSRRYESAVNVRKLTGGKIRYEFKTDDDKARTIARLTKALATVKRAPPLPDLFLTAQRLEVGQVGTCPPSGVLDEERYYWDYRVLQVLNETAALIRVELWRASGFATRPPDRVADTIVWLNRDTKGLVDDKRIEIDGVMSVTGTKQYDTAGGGSNTVFVLAPFDVTPFLPEPAPELRTWSDASGKFSIEATLVTVDGAIVKLEKWSGEVIEVPIQRLSKADQEYLNSLEQ